ncbi:predicted protein [Histoplasma mississippiense (nom. inval.)]|uniref:predicted protein n=1 Tax=Ajellomyces capsulatus (strain NAm1 / WU24) TaxID=2059318 RepID=UPI000157D133|nr:predicted protein [Histoplasma mississippiense (nom. inval.)]EDN11290.1 predicted protein [Histoplasma mississippiense (nom. inval.)]
MTAEPTFQSHVHSPPEDCLLFSHRKIRPGHVFRASDGIVMVWKLENRGRSLVLLARLPQMGEDMYRWHDLKTRGFYGCSLQAGNGAPLNCALDFH